jgi:threonine dehydrogenase-like Zn-dependent dehydrogenase
VLIAVKHVGICGSNLHIFHDTHPNHPPVTLVLRQEDFEG